MKLKFGLMILLVMCRKFLEKIIEWKEREHGAEDMAAFHDPNTIEALRDCSLLEFFKIQIMRKQVLLLEHLTRMWDANDQLLNVGPHTIDIEMKDIYFLIGLSKWREPIILVGYWGNEV